MEKTAIKITIPFEKMKSLAVGCARQAGPERLIFPDSKYNNDGMRISFQCIINYQKLIELAETYVKEQNLPICKESKDYKVSFDEDSGDATISFTF
jgi:hypothetical protein